MKRLSTFKKIANFLVLSVIVMSLNLCPLIGISANVNPNQNSTFAGPPPIDVEYDM